MTGRDYVNNAMRTKSNKYELGEIHPDVMHGAIGLSTEIGEIWDHLKKVIFYGASLDRVNLMEEVGDIMWYVACMCNGLGVDLDAVMEQNVAKLKKRYPGNWTAEDSEHRDLPGERKLLEDTSETTISTRTLEQLDRSADNLTKGKAGAPCDLDSFEKYAYGEPEEGKPITYIPITIDLDRETYDKLAAIGWRTLKPDEVTDMVVERVALKALTEHVKAKAEEYAKEVKDGGD